jgi:hypothetical protein
LTLTVNYSKKQHITIDSVEQSFQSVGIAVEEDYQKSEAVMENSKLPLQC